jgi:hypothetical protein
VEDGTLSGMYTVTVFDASGVQQQTLTGRFFSGRRINP